MRLGDGQLEKLIARLDCCVVPTTVGIALEPLMTLFQDAQKSGSGKSGGQTPVR
jgi:hypothetical protein